MVVYAPEVSSEELPAKLDALRSLIERESGAVIEMDDWGRRRLGYPIQKRFEGQYVLAHFERESDASNVELERALTIDESVLRHLLVRAETADT